MYVEPNSTVYLMKNVPLDPTYQHTVLFNSRENQAAVMLTYTEAGLQFENQSYQRHGRGYLRVAKNVGELLNCNYMMFRNYNSETLSYDRWFYAFVTDVEYVNEATTLVRYEIDIMQTWLFDYQLDPVFVEREHSTTDVAGDNLLEDNLEHGEYIFRDYQRVGVFGKGQENPMKVLMYVTAEESGGEPVPVAGGNYGGIYAGAKRLEFTTAEEVNAWISANPTCVPDAIVGMVMCPDRLIPAAGGSGGTFDPDAIFTAVAPLKNFSDIDGYVPKNKKLFTYPYNFLYVSNNTGSGKELAYEYFSEPNVCSMYVVGNGSLGGDALLVPSKYKGTSLGGSDEKQLNYNEAISLGGLPMCVYNIDAFKAWWAQNQGQETASWGSSIISAITGAFGAVGSGDPTRAATGVLGGVASLASSAMQAAGKLRDQRAKPPITMGDVSTPTLWSAGAFGFWYGHMTIRAEYAKIIDQFWSKFGYPSNRIKVPNRNARANWSFVKTRGCEFTGSIPASDAERIKSIYDNGVTFWNDIAKVGQYGDFTNPINE